MRCLFLLLAALWALPAHAQNAPAYNCSGSVGTTAANISFPASGTTGPQAPTTFLLISNPHASNTLWVNPLPGGTAAANTAGSAGLAPGAALSWSLPLLPPPASISIIASGTSTPYTCWYQ